MRQQLIYLLVDYTFILFVLCLMAELNLPHYITWEQWAVQPFFHALEAHIDWTNDLNHDIKSVGSCLSMTC